MVIHLMDYQAIGFALVIASIFFLLGGAYEYAKKGGSYDLRRDLRASYRDAENLRELVHAGNYRNGGDHVHPSNGRLRVVREEASK